MQLPEDFKVYMISEERDVPIMLLELLNADVLGIDSEWCTRPAVFQISSQHQAFLIDMIALADSKILDFALCILFREHKATVLGFSFYNDLDMFSIHLPEMQFYQVFHNFLDLQHEYARWFRLGWIKTGLTQVVRDILGIEMLKDEQVSNWETRPLSSSQ